MIVVLPKRLAFHSCHGKSKVVEDRHRGIVLLRISDDEARIGQSLDACFFFLQSWSHFQRQLQLVVFAKHFVTYVFLFEIEILLSIFHWSMASS